MGAKTDNLTIVDTLLQSKSDRPTSNDITYTKICIMAMAMATRFECYKSFSIARLNSGDRFCITANIFFFTEIDCGDKLKCIAIY